jgi:3-carboxy-cis,cis-muconate cycloisomerase
LTTFASLFVPEAVRDAVSDAAWLEAMLDAERALANAAALAGALDASEAAAVADACDASLYDIDALAAEGRAVANPVEPLVRALRERAPAVHRGATSQDILDTASMLVARRALGEIARARASRRASTPCRGCPGWSRRDVQQARAACAKLARTHRSTPMAARTLLQQAVPTTFGYVAAQWYVSLGAAEPRLPAQLGGAAGTLAAFGEHALELKRRFAAELELEDPQLPWHTNRAPVAELAGFLDRIAQAAAKIALDVILLAQSEVGEVREASGGGSSTMPHKRNPARARTRRLRCWRRPATTSCSAPRAPGRRSGTR